MIGWDWGGLLRLVGPRVARAGACLANLGLRPVAPGHGAIAESQIGLQAGGGGPPQRHHDDRVRLSDNRGMLMTTHQHAWREAGDERGYLSASGTRDGAAVRTPRPHALAAGTPCPLERGRPTSRLPTWHAAPSTGRTSPPIPPILHYLRTSAELDEDPYQAVVWCSLSVRYPTSTCVQTSTNHPARLSPTFLASRTSSTRMYAAS